MVEEQSKLDEFANVLITQMNAIHNTGASIPGRPTMVGDVLGLTGTDVISASGTLRIALTDNNGIVQNNTDLNLTGVTTVNDLIAAINGAFPQVNASLTPDGQLSIISVNPNLGIVLNQGTTSLGGGEDFSTFFGLNNVFAGDGADNISVSEYLRNNGEYLSNARVSDAAAFFPGSVALNVGDSVLIQELHDVISNSYSFNAAGNFAAQTKSLDNYIDSIIADAAYRASNADQNATITKSLMDQTKTTLQNLSGVNIDEEMAHLIDLEAKYEASATMIKALQEMFDALLAAVR
jgi:flagellar hook-associated protein 1 FlgK